MGTSITAVLAFLFIGGASANLPGSGADPCDLSSCSDYATCTSDGDSYECECLMGFEGDGFSCYDVNECDGDNYCYGPTVLYCNNTVGSYNCTCVGGYFYSYVAKQCIEIDSDEPFRAPTQQLPGCNKTANVYRRAYLGKRVQQFLAEFVHYTGLSTGSGAGGY